LGSDLAGARLVNMERIVVLSWKGAVEIGKHVEGRGCGGWQRFGILSSVYTGRSLFSREHRGSGICWGVRGAFTRDRIGVEREDESRGLTDWRAAGIELWDRTDAVEAILVGRWGLRGGGLIPFSFRVC